MFPYIYSFLFYSTLHYRQVRNWPTDTMHAYGHSSVTRIISETVYCYRTCRATHHVPNAHVTRWIRHGSTLGRLLNGCGRFTPLLLGWRRVGTSANFLNSLASRFYQSTPTGCTTKAWALTRSHMSYRPWLVLSNYRSLMSYRVWFVLSSYYELCRDVFSVL